MDSLKMYSISIFFLSLSLYAYSAPLQKAHPGYSINLIGHLKDSGSISPHTASFVHCLYPDINLNFFKTYPSSPDGFPDHFKNIIEAGVNAADYKHTHKDKALTGMSIYADSIVMTFWKNYTALQDRSMVKFAYCVTERTLVPMTWITRLNRSFDAILVPDEWLVEVFKNSGITLPIFVLPEIIDLHSLLERPLKKARKNPFVFGFSGGCWDRKNHQMIIDAFAQEFGNNPHVVLKIHGRHSTGFEKIIDLCKQKNVKNIVLEQKNLLRHEYEDFLASLDCYVTASKGEGFSIIPREVLALGIPCIVSNNTAQKTICNSGYVYSIPSEILEPSYLIFGGERGGFHFNCTLEDVRKALRSVYSNYSHYLTLAAQGREWVKQYLPENLERKYKTLVKPSMVVLGDHNEITEECVITNSNDLFVAYKILCDPKQTTFTKKNIKKEPIAMVNKQKEPLVKIGSRKPF